MMYNAVLQHTKLVKDESIVAAATIIASVLLTLLPLSHAAGAQHRLCAIATLPCICWQATTGSQVHSHRLHIYTMMLRHAKPLLLLLLVLLLLLLPHQEAAVLELLLQRCQLLLNG
jgi:hypothetical protein